MSSTPRPRRPAAIVAANHIAAIAAAAADPASTAAAADDVRPPIDSYEDILLPPRSVIAIDSDSDDEHGMHRGNIRFNGAAAAAASLPLVSQSRVIGGSKACEKFKCCIGASSCMEYLPVKFLAMPCSHVLCVECFEQASHAMHGANAKKKPYPCPMCKSPIAHNAHSSGLIASVFYTKLKVSCVYAGCPAKYELGLDMCNERRHLAMCGFRPTKCPTCAAPMTAEQVRKHLCPKRLEECKSCHEMVAVDKMQAHVAEGETAIEGRAVPCGGMIVCPLGCVSDEAIDQSIVTHRPHAKRAKVDGDIVVRRQQHATLVPRSQLDAHKAVCPSRPVRCFYAGCDYPLVHHELAGHKRKAKHIFHHMECLEMARVKSLADDPFPNFSSIYNDIFKLPVASLGGLATDDYKWEPTPHGVTPFSHLVVTGVEDVTRFEFEVRASRRDSRQGKMVTAELVIEPAHLDSLGGINIPPHRHFAVSIRICRAGVVGSDKNILDGTCVDSGVYFSRFTSEFTMSGNLAVHCMDVFPEELMRRAAADPTLVSHGDKPFFALYVELFEKKADN